MVSGKENVQTVGILKSFRASNPDENVPKGQQISKQNCRAADFSIFGRICSSTILFWVLLTFRERISTRCVLLLSNLREIPWSNWCLAKSWQMAIFTLLSPGQFLVSCLTERAIYLELFTTKLSLNLSKTKKMYVLNTKQKYSYVNNDFTLRYSKVGPRWKFLVPPKYSSPITSNYQNSLCLELFQQFPNKICQVKIFH